MNIAKRSLIRVLELSGYDCDYMDKEKSTAICKKKNMRDVKISLDDSVDFIFVGNDKFQIKDKENIPMDLIDKIRTGNKETSLYDFFESD